jgi:Trk-type K+ transport system membrane component
MALALGRVKTPEIRRAHLAIVGGISYTLLLALLLWQALRGQSVIHPDAVTGAALTVWAIVTAAMVLIVLAWSDSDTSADSPVSMVLGGGR